MTRDSRLNAFTRRLLAALAFVVAGSATPQLAGAQTCSSVRYDAPSGSTYSIEYVFASPVRCGQYANGDWWVVAPVQITEITPTAAGGRNGCEVDPSHFNQNPFDSRTNNYNSSTLCTVPQTFSSGTTSIVKAASSSTDCAGRHCLEFATVLTVVDTPPANPGDAFRPPWFGSTKPSKTFRVSQLDMNRMPALPTDRESCCGRRPTVADVASRFRHIQLGDHLDRHHQRRVKPRDNFTFQGEDHDYHAEMASDNAVSIMRLLLADMDWNNPTDKQALINYVQAGIDMYWILDRGLVWANHSMGRKILPTVAGFLLDDADIKAVAGSTAPRYGENTTVYYSQRADNGRGKALWGRVPDDEDEYWTIVETNGGSGYRWIGDPYGYIDGSYAVGQSSGYQYCCSSMGIKYESLAVRLLGAGAVFNHAPFHEYADRWVEDGYFTANDRCAPYDGDSSNRGVTYGPAPGNSSTCHTTQTCACIEGTGRFPQAHNTRADSGYYRHSFGDDMWAAFRSCLDDGCPGMPGTTPGGPPPPPPPPPGPPAPPVLLDP
jgi:hypothetical protein